MGAGRVKVPALAPKTAAFVGLAVGRKALIDIRTPLTFVLMREVIS